MEAYRTEFGRPPTVRAAATVTRNLCYANRDQLSAGLICAGWDAREGGSVFSVPQVTSVLLVSYYWYLAWGREELCNFNTFILFDARTLPSGLHPYIPRENLRFWAFMSMLRSSHIFLTWPSKQKKLSWSHEDL